MKVSIILSMIILCSCSKYKGSWNSLTYDTIEIAFHGYSKDYDTEGKIRMSVTDTTDIKKLNVLKNASKRTFLANLRGSDYIIRIVYTDSKTGYQLLTRILKSTESRPVIEFGSGTMFDNSYKNEELVSYVTSIIKLDAIKQYEGELTQEEYDKLLLVDE